MNYPGDDRPPNLMLAFFRWFCHPESREDIEGDLLERFHNRVTKLGLRKAKWLFTKDVLLLFRPGIIRNLKGQTQYKFFNMKNINWIRLTLINVLFIIMIMLPFLPGPPNKLVIGLSVFAQSAGFFGLLLIPIGIIWSLVEIRNGRNRNNENSNWRQGYSLASITTAIIIAVIGLFVVGLKGAFFGPLLMLLGIIWAIMEIRNLGNRNNENSNWRPAYSLAIIATIIITAIYLLLVFGLFLNSGALGLLVLIPGALGLNMAIRRIRNIRINSDRNLSSMPFYLLTIPLIALITRVYLVEPVSDYSRNFAINRCEALIASIEDFKDKEGQYPESIQDLETRYIKKIPSPFIMGILNFRYNKINDHYSISFSQWLEIGSLEQIVLYDRDNLRNNLEGKFAKYDYKFDLCRVNAAFASYDTGHGYWRYYQCD